MKCMHDRKPTLNHHTFHDAKGGRGVEYAMAV